MSTLEDDLRELSDLLPGLPGEASAASLAATALVAATAPLIEELEGLDEAAGESARVTSQLGQAFVKHAGELEQHLRDAVAETGASWETARQGIESAAEGTLASALELFKAKTALLASIGEIAAVNPGIAGQDATERLRVAASEGKQDLHDTSAVLHQEAEAFHELLEMVSRINAATEALQARASEIRDRIVEDAAALSQAMAQKTRELDDALRGSLAALVAELEDQRDLTREGLGDGVGRPLGEAGDAAHQALVALGGGIEERDRRLVQARAQFTQAFTELDEAARSIPDTLREIHEAYQRIDGL